MSYSKLENKEKIILNLTVEVYLQTGRPVSSGYLAQRLNYQVSPATIRNVMAELEREGYLSQPHTSAGRIPTDEGLKFYVNSIMDEALVNVSDSFGPCPEDLALDSGEMDTVLLQVSQILANTSDNLAFVISPQISRVNFDQVRFIKLKDNKIMLVLLSTFNLVQTEIFETQMLFTQAELDRAAQYLNLNFRGKNLAYVRDYLFRELPKLKIKYEDLVEKMISLLKNYLAPEREKSKIFIQGTARLLEKVEFFDLQ
ncbi:MAG: heat-inducible transcription repressor HrcA, partial [Candidatus Aminicenantes bacterium]|nr:heat-inducible transcription repressor HrcA [Candidatus Aminicenantes bacterium]